MTDEPARHPASSDDEDPAASSPEASYLERRREARELGREKGELYRTYMHTSVSGMEIGVAIGLGALIGWWLDRTYGWRPWGMLTGLALGMGHAAKILVNMTRKAMLENDEEEGAAPSDEPPPGAPSEQDGNER